MGERGGERQSQDGDGCGGCAAKRTTHRAATGAPPWFSKCPRNRRNPSSGMRHVPWWRQQSRALALALAEQGRRRLDGILHLHPACLAIGRAIRPFALPKPGASQLQLLGGLLATSRRTSSGTEEKSRWGREKRKRGRAGLLCILVKWKTMVDTKGDARWF